MKSLVECCRIALKHYRTPNAKVLEITDIGDRWILICGQGGEYIYGNIPITVNKETGVVEADRFTPEIFDLYYNNPDVPIPHNI